MLGGSEKEKEIVSEADRLDVHDKAPLVLMELLFDANMLLQIKQYKSLLRRVGFIILFYGIIMCNSCYRFSLRIITRKLRGT